MTAKQTIVLFTLLILVFKAMGTEPPKAPQYWIDWGDRSSTVLVLKPDSTAEYFRFHKTQGREISVIHDQGAKWGIWEKGSLLSGSGGLKNKSALACRTSSVQAIWVSTKTARYDYHVTKDFLCEVDKMGVQSILRKGVGPGL